MKSSFVPFSIQPLASLILLSLKQRNLKLLDLELIHQFLLLLR